MIPAGGSRLSGSGKSRSGLDNKVLAQRGWILRTVWELFIFGFGIFCGVNLYR